MRYLALNPCRDGLCADPLEWTWSTYRDLFGASAESWVDLAKLARELGDSACGFADRFHAYVSGDPSVAVAGTPPPRPAPPRELAVEPIVAILEAAAAALRKMPNEVSSDHALRKLFIHLAIAQGWHQPRLLAQISDLSPRTVRHILSAQPPPAIAAALVCLGDARLRRVPKCGKKLFNPLGVAP